MSGVSDFVRANVVSVYFVYGLAFFSLGLVTTLQARAMSAERPLDRLWLLGAFGLSHGVSEWVELATIQGWLAADFSSSLNLILKVVSFAFLIQFGVEFLRGLRPIPRWLRFLAPGLVSLWLLLVVFVPVDSGVRGETWRAVANAAMRYGLAVPGDGLAAYALWTSAARRGDRGQGRPSAKYFRGAAISLAAYGVVGGLTVSAAPFFPASFINAQGFEATFGFPIVVLRTLCAVAIGGFLAEAFVVEASRAQARAVALLQQMDQMREEFISIVAHDLRSPISVISGYADVLKALPEGQHETPLEERAVEGIRNSTRHLNRMVGDLLDVSRIDARQLTLTQKWVDLRRLVAEVVERSRAITTGHDVRLQAKDSEIDVYADAARIEQVLTNLLSNAAKYSFPGTPIRVTVERGKGEAVVSVTNEGRGIAPEERGRLFGRFERTRDARAGGVPGLGLGLHIAKGLVEAHGGRIWLEEKSTGAGRAETTFRFTLPIRDD